MRAALSVQKRSMTMAIATMEQRMIGSINQPPALMISATVGLRKLRRLLYHIRPGAVPVAPCLQPLLSRRCHRAGMTDAKVQGPAQGGIEGSGAGLRIAFGDRRARMSELAAITGRVHHERRLGGSNEVPAGGCRAAMVGSHYQVAAQSVARACCRDTMIPQQLRLAGSLDVAGQ